MKRRYDMYFRNIMLYVLLNVFLIASTEAQVYEQSRQYDRSYALNDETEVVINNKYGNIHIHTWDNDSVKFEVEVRVSSNRQARVDRIFNNIDVQFTANRNYVIATTTFASASGLLSEITDLGRSLINSGGIAEINYQLWIPEHITLKVDNRFGNIYTTDHSGRIEFRLSNGDLQVNELSGKSVVSIDFGHANIRNIEDGRVELNYANLDLNQAGELSLNGRSSTINIQHINQLQLNSRRDQINIDEAAVVTGESSFSRATINAITEHIMLNGNYGSIQVSGLHNAFQYMHLNTNYTSVQLYLHTSISANLEINYSKRTKLLLPAGLETIESIELEPGGEAGMIRGVFGVGKPSALKFTMTGGEISIFSQP